MPLDDIPFTAFAAPAQRKSITDYPFWIGSAVIFAVLVGGTVLAAFAVVATALSIYGLWDLGNFLLGH